jgi:hypothetical protein
MKSNLRVALVAGYVLALSGGAAYAATITDIISFTASGFGAGAPVDPVIGTFTITLDPTVDNFSWDQRCGEQHKHPRWRHALF